MKIQNIDYTEPVTANGKDVEFVGCTFHKGLVWMGSGSGSVRECIFYASQQGHGLYTHNNGGGVREINKCLFLPYSGRFGLHIYSGGANWLKDYSVTDCIHLAPVQIGGGYGVRNLNYSNNVHISTHAGFGTYANSGITNSGAITSNKFINCSDVEITNDFNCSGNECYSVTPKKLPTGFSLVALPREWSIVIPFIESKENQGIEAKCINGIASARVIKYKNHGNGIPSLVDIMLFGLATIITIRRRKAK